MKRDEKPGIVSPAETLLLADNVANNVKSESKVFADFTSLLFISLANVRNAQFIHLLYAKKN
jgi:hypothetical protein